MAGDDSKAPRDEDDALERAELEREVEAFERSRRIAPSRLVDLPDADLVMSQINFDGHPLIWLGEQAQVFVHFRAGERMTNKPLDVTWTSLDANVIAIRETARQGSSAQAILAAVAPGTTTIVVTSKVGHRKELEIRVVDRTLVPTEWF
jgi:hypothetical protein